MVLKFFLVAFFLFLMCITITARPPKKAAMQTTILLQTAKLKLVVGIVIDQMRWDYLYRFNHLYSNNGFKRLIAEGFSCDNNLIAYTPTYTAPGHTCIYTGSVPAINGIVGNFWFDKSVMQMFTAPMIQQ